MRMTIGFLATRTFGVGLGLLLLSGCDVMRAARDDFASLTAPKPPPPAAPVRKAAPQPVAAAQPVKPVTAAAVADTAAAPDAACTGDRELLVLLLLVEVVLVDVVAAAVAEAVVVVVGKEANTACSWNISCSSLFLAGCRILDSALASICLMRSLGRVKV